MTVDGTKYERLTSSTCSKCLDFATNLIRLIGFMIILIIGLAIMIWYLLLVPNTPGST